MTDQPSPYVFDYASRDARELVRVLNALRNALNGAPIRAGKIYLLLEDMDALLGIHELLKAHGKDPTDEERRWLLAGELAQFLKARQDRYPKPDTHLT